MTTVTLKSKLASITDELTGGCKDEITVPSRARDRNTALYEAMRLLLEKEKELIALREQLAQAQDALGLVDRVRMQELRKQAEAL